MPDRLLDGALLGAGGYLGVVIGFFAVVVLAARTPLSLSWITVLAMAGGLAGGLSMWMVYRMLLRRRPRSVRWATLAALAAAIAWTTLRLATTVLVR